MKVRVLSMLLLLVIMNGMLCAQKLAPDAIVGTWLTADKTGEITIFKNKDRYFGRITGGTSDEEFDVHNRDEARRNDALIGLVILEDLQFNAVEQLWKDGTVYDPKNGKRYSCHVRVVDSHTLKITGYVGFSWIGRSEEWSRLH